MQTPRATLFPYTTLFRSRHQLERVAVLLGVTLRRAEILRRRALDRGRRRISARRKDRKSTRLNSSYSSNSYAVFCLKKITSPRRNGERRRAPTASISKE